MNKSKYRGGTTVGQLYTKNRHINQSIICYTLIPNHLRA